MLQQHHLQCAVLPAIYGNKAHVTKAFDRLVRLQSAMLHVAERYRSGALALPLIDGWSAFGGL